MNYKINLSLLVKLREGVKAMEKFLLSGVVILSASTVSLAADVVPPAPLAYDWAGVTSV